MEHYSKPSEAIIGYTAGFIDADGTVWIAGTGTNRFRVQISQALSNNGREICDWFQQTWGIGRVYEQFGLCHIAIWNVTRINDIQHLLGNCLPYMRVKRSKAQAAVEFLESLAKGGKRGIWSPGELSYIRNHGSSKSADEIAEELKRSANAVRAKRRELGISAPVRIY